MISFLNFKKNDKKCLTITLIILGNIAPSKSSLLILSTYSFYAKYSFLVWNSNNSVKPQ